MPDKDFFDKFKAENISDLNRAAQIAQNALGNDTSKLQSFLSQNSDFANSLMSMLSEEDMNNLSNLIKNPQLLSKILSSPKARENLKKIMEK